MNNGNEPAYPVENRSLHGLTKREAFAMAAMQGVIARGYDTQMRGYEGWREEFAREANRYADHQLATLQENSP